MIIRGAIGLFLKKKVGRPICSKLKVGLHLFMKKKVGLEFETIFFTKGFLNYIVGKGKL